MATQPIDVRPTIARLRAVLTALDGGDTAEARADLETVLEQVEGWCFYIRKVEGPTGTAGARKKTARKTAARKGGRKSTARKARKRNR